ncbi:hypothetical protein AGMMS49521_1890 [Campylobacterota bacterium]|nr:hypothetical protein AGMMS49521_1890 [Campylobacterota bacterium]
MYAVKGYFDGKTISVLQPIPVSGAYDVVVTFLEPAANQPPQNASVKERKAALDSLVGIIKGNTITLDEAKAERLARRK